MTKNNMFTLGLLVSALVSVTSSQAGVGVSVGLGTPGYYEDDYVYAPDTCRTYCREYVDETVCYNDCLYGRRASYWGFGGLGLGLGLGYGYGRYRRGYWGRGYGHGHYHGGGHHYRRGGVGRVGGGRVGGGRVGGGGRGGRR